MKLVLGLGNYGQKYLNTRHNIGFLLVDAFAERNRIKTNKKGYFSYYGVGEIASIKIIVAKPQTFMNLSGKAVVSLLNSFHIPPGDMIVVHDDIDLGLGRIKTKIGGGDGGHRGIRSIVSAIGTREFQRVRIGVGRPPHHLDVVDYVLSPFGKGESKEVKETILNGVEVVERVLEA